MMRTVAIVAAALIGIGLAAQDDKKSDKVQELIKKLGDNDYKVREEAQKDLAEMGDSVLPQLKKALEETKDLETKSRLQILVNKYEKGKTKVEKKTAKKPEEKLKQIKELADKLAKAVADESKPAEDRLKEAEKVIGELSKATQPKFPGLAKIVINGKEYKFGGGDDDNGEDFNFDDWNKDDWNKDFEDHIKKLKKNFKFKFHKFGDGNGDEDNDDGYWW